MTAAPGGGGAALALGTAAPRVGPAGGAGYQNPPPPAPTLSDAGTNPAARDARRTPFLVPLAVSTGYTGPYTPLVGEGGADEVRVEQAAKYAAVAMDSRPFPGRY